MERNTCMACGDEPRELVSTWATCLGERQIVSLCRRCYSARMGIRDAVELAWDRQYLQQELPGDKTECVECRAPITIVDGDLCLTCLRWVCDGCIGRHGCYLAAKDVDAGASFNAGAKPRTEKGGSL